MQIGEVYEGILYFTCCRGNVCPDFRDGANFTGDTAELSGHDQTKERLDCYDDKIKPAPKQVSAPAKKVQDCRFLKEEDERLNCFNRFVNPPPKKNTVQQKLKQPAAGTKTSVPAKQ